jgi:hypothetical protein
VLEVPFLLLPIIAAYLILLRRKSRQFWTAFAVCGLGYTLAAVALASKIEPYSLIEPMLGDWVSPLARYGVPLAGNGGVPFLGKGPIVLGQTTRILLTVVSTLATLCAIAFLWEIRRRVVGKEVDQVDPQAGAWSRTPRSVSWNQVLLLAGPFAAAYFALLIPRSSNHLYDRYLPPLVFLSGLGLIRAFQNFVQPNLPVVTKVLVGLVAIYSIGATHDMFAFYRARVALANEVAAAGVPPNTLDGGFEYNGWIEVAQGGHLNDEKIVNPPNSYIPLDPYRGLSCDGKAKKMDLINNEFPHFFPRYGLSFTPDDCAGQTSFAPVNYFRWLGLRSASLYVVNYQPRKGH